MTAKRTIAGLSDLEREANLVALIERLHRKIEAGAYPGEKRQFSGAGFHPAKMTAAAALEGNLDSVHWRMWGQSRQVTAFAVDGSQPVISSQLLKAHRSPPTTWNLTVAIDQFPMTGESGGQDYEIDVTSGVGTAQFTQRFFFASDDTPAPGFPNGYAQIVLSVPNLAAEEINVVALWTPTVNETSMLVNFTALVAPMVV
jgi:hypothetical protein